MRKLSAIICSGVRATAVETSFAWFARIRHNLSLKPPLPTGEGGGEGRCAPCDCVGRAARFNGPLPCAHTVAPKGARGSWDKAPHPNPLPLGEGTRHSRQGLWTMH